MSTYTYYSAGPKYYDQEPAPEYRDWLVKQAIMKLVDALYLKMFSCRSGLTSKSVAHISRAVISAKTESLRLLDNLNLNDQEIEVLNKLKSLCEAIQPKGTRIPRVIYRPELVTALLSRIPDSELEINYTKTVLGTLAQFKIKTNQLTIPQFSIHPNGTSYCRNLRTVQGVKLELDLQPTDPASVWSNIFFGIKFSSQEIVTNSIIEILTILSIDLLPDASSGLGLTIFPVEQVIRCSRVRAYLKEINCSYYDFSYIFTKLTEVNPTLTIPKFVELSDSMQTELGPATEAVDDPPEDKDTEDPEEELAEEDPEEGDDQTESDEDSEDPDTPEGEDTSGEDTPDESRPMILGLNLKLAKGETLDDFLYKLTVANYILSLIHI